MADGTVPGLDATRGTKRRGGRPLHRQRFVVVDVETTGLAADTSHVLEVGWARYEDGEEVTRGASLVAFDGDIPPVVEEMTGLSVAQLIGAPPLGDVLDLFATVTDGVSFVAAYNAPFDAAHLDEAARRTGRSVALPRICALSLARRLLPSLELGQAE